MTQNNIETVMNIIMFFGILAFGCAIGYGVGEKSNNTEFAAEYKCVQETPITEEPPRVYVCANYVRVK